MSFLNGYKSGWVGCSGVEVLCSGKGVHSLAKSKGEGPLKQMLCPFL